jgi:hypothetical protein
MGIKRTDRQMEIMGYIIDTGTARGSWLDIDELMQLLAKVNSKQSVQCSIRYLEQHGLLKREYAYRRARRRMILVPTAAGFAGYRPAATIPLSVPGVGPAATIPHSVPGVGSAATIPHSVKGVRKAGTPSAISVTFLRELSVPAAEEGAPSPAGATEKAPSEGCKSVLFLGRAGNI